MKHNKAIFERLAQLLRDLGIGEPAAVGRIHLVPLLLDNSGPDAQLLHEALHDGVAHVEELDDSGNVIVIRVRHTGS